VARFNPHKGPRPKGPALAKRIRASRKKGGGGGSKSNAWRNYVSNAPLPD
jgi:hypothetical protein